MSYRPEWLAERADVLISRLEATPAPEPHFDVVVIGSGYGGAVAAARFARAKARNGKPLRVCVLERGAEYIPGSFPARVADVPWHVRLSRPDDADVKGRADGLYDFRLGKDVSALVGNGLGGGSLINAGVAEEPEPDVFADRQWPPALRRDTGQLKEMFERARAMLNARTADTRDLAKYGRLEKAAAAAGFRARPVTVAVRSQPDGRNEQGVMQKQCVRCGDCVTGCNFSAKNTLPMNYLAEAKALGASLYVGATVSHVEKRDGYWEVLWRRTGNRHPTDRDPAHPDRDRSYALRARHVVISAGTFGSTEILLRSRAHGLHVSGKLGKRFSTNGDMIGVLYNERGKVNAVAREEQDFRARNVGPTITGMFSSGGPRDRRIVVEELAVPGLLARLFAEIVTTGALPVQLGRMDWSRYRRDGKDPAAVYDEHIANTQVFAAMGDDGAKGSMELVEGWSKGSPDGAVRVEWKDAGKAPIYEAQDRLLVKSEDLGGMYLRNPLWKPLPDSLADMLSGERLEGSLFTVHPLGGCPMGEDWKEGVVDDLGQVYDPSETADLARVHPGLLVLDGSIVPVALGINPLLTITALAERAAQRYIEEQGWEVRDTLARFDTEPPAVEQRKRAQPPNTMVRFSERMRGPLRFSPDGEAHETALDVTFDPIGGGDGGLPAFLRGGPHEVNIGRGSLAVNVKSKRDEDAEVESRREQEDEDARRRREILDNERSAGRPATDQKLEALWREVRDRETREERERLERLKRQPAQARVPVRGKVWWMERAPSCAGTRSIRALWAYTLNRGIADVLQDVRREGFKKGLLGKAGKLWSLVKLASNVGETRYLRYELTLGEELRAGDVRLPKGTVIKGLKTFRYAYAENPWKQLSVLTVTLEPPRGGAVDAGTLEIDLKHLIRRFTAMFQILQQRDQPTAMLDVASIALFMARIVAKIHFWSFRAPEYEQYEGGRAKRRLPGALDGLRWKVFPVSVARQDKQGKAKPPLALQLTRYWQGKEPPEKPVMLIHGFGSGGVQFTHPELKKNALARHLAEAGHDVWVVELRTSIALPYSRNQWTLDEIAKEDIPALVDEVLRQSGQKKVDVVAHCIGSAMFCTAVLGHRHPADERPLHDKIRSATLLQVGPLITLSPGNRFRGYMAAAMRRFMLTDHVDSSIDSRATALDTMIDRLLWTYPYPKEEQRHHALCPPWRAHTHIANCNRSAAVFGRLVQHDRVVEHDDGRRNGLDLLGDMIGHTNLTTFEQTGQYAFAERLTDHDASNLYVTDENVVERFGFPVRFIHGEKNDVFNVETSRRSLRLLQDLFQGRHTSDRVVVENYGHLDPLIGFNAHNDVFPYITAFLRGDSARGNAQLDPKLELRQNYPRPPLIGPVLGWTRREESGRVARIWCRTDDQTSYAYFLIAVVLGGDAKEPPAYMQPLHDGNGGSRLGELDLLGVIDVPLPDEDRDYEIVVVGAHRSSVPNMSSDPALLRTHPLLTLAQAQQVDTTIRANMESLAEGAAKDGPKPSSKARAKAVEATPLPPGYAGAVIAEREAWKDSLADARAARTVDDPGYFSRIDSVHLPRTLLERLDRQPSIEFALACCRFSASLIDREHADASFGLLRGLVEPGAAARPLSLLLLIGDQIYADATAGMFDPKNRRGRFDDSYREVWTAPNARAVLSRLPTYMMMDDHEVADDWHPQDREEKMVKGMPDCRDWGLIAFEDYQLAHSPRGRLAVAPGKARRKAEGPYYYAFQSGGFDFFVCDTRSEREGRSRIISAAQMAALLDWLDRTRPADGRPRFVVSPSVVLPECLIEESDDWSGFRDSLRDLFSHIEKHDMRVVFLCGDSHLAMATRITLPGRPPHSTQCLCIASTPLYAPMPFANARRSDARDAGAIALSNGSEMTYRRRAGSIVQGDGVTIVGAVKRVDGWWVTVDIYQQSRSKPKQKAYKLD
jgi:choline dehydrogenase-like flavoprotein